jgi:hypothetical protein
MATTTTQGASGPGPSISDLDQDERPRSRPDAGRARREARKRTTMSTTITTAVEAIYDTYRARLDHMSYRSRRGAQRTKWCQRGMRAADLLRVRADRLATQAPSPQTQTRTQYATRAEWRMSLFSQAERNCRAGWSGLATSLGASYHRHVESLASSSEAVCAYGRGGQDDLSRDSYSKGWHRKFGPRRWKNFGASWTDAAHSLLRLENHLGKHVATIAIALPRDWRKSVTTAGLLDGDLYGVRAARMIVRHGVDGRCTGVAVALTPDLTARFGKYEHGTTYAACRAEIAHKRTILAEEIARQQAEQAAQEQARHRERLCRHVRLVAGLRVGFAHARAAGMCEQGISTFCAAHGLDIQTGATVADLRALPDSRWVPAAQVALREALAARSVA